MGNSHGKEPAPGVGVNKEFSNSSHKYRCEVDFAEGQLLHCACFRMCVDIACLVSDCWSVSGLEINACTACCAATALRNTHSIVAVERCLISRASIAALSEPFVDEVLTVGVVL